MGRAKSSRRASNIHPAEAAEGINRMLTMGEQTRALRELQGLIRSLELIGDASSEIVLHASSSCDCRRILEPMDAAKDAITDRILKLVADLPDQPLQSLENARSCADIVDFVCDESCAPCRQITKLLIQFVRSCADTCPSCAHPIVPPRYSKAPDRQRGSDAKRR